MVVEGGVPRELRCLALAEAGEVPKAPQHQGLEVGEVQTMVQKHPESAVALELESEACCPWLIAALVVP
jgi:hypothetical protein